MKCDARLHLFVILVYIEDGFKMLRFEEFLPDTESRVRVRTGNTASRWRPLATRGCPDQIQDTASESEPF